MTSLRNRFSVSESATLALTVEKISCLTALGEHRVGRRLGVDTILSPPVADLNVGFCAAAPDAQPDSPLRRYRAFAGA